MMNKKIYFVFGVFLISVFSHVVGASNSANGSEQIRDKFSVEAENLIKAVAELDDRGFLTKINGIKNSQYSVELVGVVKDFWGQSVCEYGFSDDEKDFLTDVEIRVELADLLVQASDNEVIALSEVELKEIRDFMLNELKKPAARYQQTVLSTLSFFDDSEVISEVGLIVKTKNSITFRSGLLSLALMCSSDASSELDKIKETLNDKELSFLFDAQQSLASYKKGVCSHH